MATRKKQASHRSLAPYQEKRDFSKSPEPSGKSAPAKTSPRQKPVERAYDEGKRIFCVQKHDATRLHYDFRLGHRGVLLSWAIPKGPSLNPSDKRLAVQVEDHPLDYAGFEGVIPEGYGAGTVMLWDTGSWDPENGDVDKALRAGELKFSLDGVKLKGSWVLVRTGSNQPKPTWLLIKHKDEWAGDVDIESFAPLSVKSDKDLEAIAGTKGVKKWNSNREKATTLKAVRKAKKSS